MNIHIYRWHTDKEVFSEKVVSSSAVVSASSSSKASAFADAFLKALNNYKKMNGGMFEFDNFTKMKRPIYKRTHSIKTWYVRRDDNTAHAL